MHIVTKCKVVQVLDAKVSFDSNALFRHPDIVELRDETEEDKKEVSKIYKLLLKYGSSAKDAKDMLKNKLIDKIVPEPLGGAHYDPDQTYESVKENIIFFYKKIKSLSKGKMIDNRRKKFTKIGNFKV